MIPKIPLKIDTKKTTVDPKYAGDPDSPNLLPPVNRQILRPEVEEELKAFCAATLGHAQPADDDLAIVARYMGKKPQQDQIPAKHDKHASFTLQPPASKVPEIAAASLPNSTSKLPSKVQKQHRRDRQDATAAIVFEPLEPSNTKGPKKKPNLINTEHEALHEIRSKLQSRPKTSAAACIDYTDPVSPAASNQTSSVKSNRSTYSTPFTSAGITPGLSSQPFPRSPPHALKSTAAEGSETTALPQITNQVEPHHAGMAVRPREWMADHLARRHHSSSWTPVDSCPKTASLRDFFPLSTSNNPTPSFQASRPPSIRNTFTQGLRQYIRPGSSSGSIRSYHSTVSTRSRTRERLSALRNKLSSGSLRSRASSRPRPGYDEGDEYFLDPEQLNLDRPLPPLPGLDSYKAKPTHISLMMKGYISSHDAKRDTRHVVIDHDGNECVMTADEEKKRQKDLNRAVMEKMSLGSIGSVSASPTGVVTVYRGGMRVNAEGEQNRPTTAGSGMGVGSVPLFKSHRDSIQAYRRQADSADPPGPPKPMGGFMKKLGGRMGWKRKSKAVRLI